MSQANYTFIKLDSEEGRRRQFLYPQLLGASYYCNAPTVMKLAWDKVFKPLCAKRIESNRIESNRIESIRFE